MIDDDYHDVSDMSSDMAYELSTTDTIVTTTGHGKLSITSLPSAPLISVPPTSINTITSGGGFGSTGQLYGINVINGNGAVPGTAASTGGFTGYTITPPTQQTMSVKGDATFEGDIKIKGKSLTDTLDRIEQRLGILHPNEELEEIWTELKELGNRYRELLKNIPEGIIEKKSVWDLLKK